MKEKVQAALDQIRPGLRMDGGDIELVDVSEDGKTVSVRLQGACHGCPASTLTLRYHVERILKQEVPGIERVIAV